MAIVFPENRKEVSDRIATDVQNEIPVLTPQLRNSVARALVVGFAGRAFDNYTQLQELLDNLFPVTAQDLDFIRRWGLFKGIDLNPERKALGFITVTGVAGSIIPDFTLFNTVQGNEYKAINQDYTISVNNLSISTLTRSGNVATASLVITHGLATNTSVTVSGADQPEYNGTFVITVPSQTSFTYVITGTPLTPATGVIVATLNSASVEIQSINTGQVQNLSVGAKVTLDTPIAGVDDDAFVQFTNISLGADTETTEAYKVRVLDAYANPISSFSSGDIDRVAKQVPGVTRVFIFEAFPEPGVVTIYFTRDNDDNIIPDSNEVTIVKNEILKIKSVPTLDSDVRVFPPTPVTVNFVFNSLIPDSQALRTAITNSLKQMFVDVAKVSVNLSQDQYRAAIINSVDPDTGQELDSFSLLTPAGDIPIAQGELAVLGSVSFSV